MRPYYGDRPITYTGRTRVRINWFNRCILQVQEQYTIVPLRRGVAPDGSEQEQTRTVWRDAMPHDLASLYAPFVDPSTE